MVTAILYTVVTLLLIFYQLSYPSDITLPPAWITSQINSLHQAPCLRLCFGGSRLRWCLLESSCTMPQRESLHPGERPGWGRISRRVRRQFPVGAIKGGCCGVRPSASIQRGQQGQYGRGAPEGTLPCSRVDFLSPFPH